MTQPHITLTRIGYLVPLNGTLHHVRRDQSCDCGGTPAHPCSAIAWVRDYLVAGGPRPLGRHPDTWPTTWSQIPTPCPVCDCPTVADRHLNSRAGPGWRCSLTGCEHFWLVRVEPLRRFRAAHPLEPVYPWYDTPDEERCAWLAAHSHPPRLVPSPDSPLVDKLAPSCPSLPTAGPPTLQAESSLYPYNDVELDHDRPTELAAYHEYLAAENQRKGMNHGPKPYRGNDHRHP